jgi:hypothetical protein
LLPLTKLFFGGHLQGSNPLYRITIRIDISQPDKRSTPASDLAPPRAGFQGDCESPDASKSQARRDAERIVVVSSCYESRPTLENTNGPATRWSFR